MSDALTTGFVVLSEISMLLVAVIAVFLVLRARRLRRDREMVSQLIRRLREQEPMRKEKLQQLLRDCCGFTDEQSQEKMETLNGHEKAVYTRMIRMFLGRERDNISTLDRNVKTLLQGYTDLIEGGDEDSQEGGAGPSSLSYTALRKENESLKDESGELKDEINRLRTELADSKVATENMMKEYATMFAGGQREGEMKVRDEMDKLKERDWVEGEEKNESETVTGLENDTVPDLNDEVEVPEFGVESPAEDKDKA